MSKIALIEDEDFLRKSIAKILSFHSHQVKAYEPSEDIIKLIEDDMPDLIISDLMMFPISGLQIIEIAQKNPNLKKIPIIILSGAGSSEKEKVIKLGAKKMIQKPFQADQLIKEVNATLQEQNP